MYCSDRYRKNPCPGPVPPHPSPTPCRVQPVEDRVAPLGARCGCAQGGVRCLPGWSRTAVRQPQYDPIFGPIASESAWLPIEATIMDPASAAPPPRTGISLRQLLMSAWRPLVELQAAPAGLDVEIRSVALLDPEDPPAARPGELVLAIGARGRAACPRAAGRRTRRRRRRGGETGRSRARPRSSARPPPRPGIALLSRTQRARWEQVDALARARARDAPQGAPAEGVRGRRSVRARRRPPPSSPAASSASRTPPTACWPTPAPPTPTRSTTCGGGPSWAGTARRRICRGCASGACSSGCAPPTR